MSIIEEDYERNLREDLLLTQFSKVLKKPDVRPLMIKLPIRNIITWIDVLRDQVENSKFYKKLETQSFEWSNEKYMQRIADNENYINILRLEDPRCLDVLKFLLDLKQVENLLNEIMTSPNYALDHLKDCQRAFKTQENLTMQLERNNNLWVKKNKDFESFLERINNEERRKQDIFNDAIDDANDDILIIDPIKMRFVIKSIKDQHTEFEDKLEAKTIALEEEIHDILKQIANIELAHDKTMELLLSQSEELQDKLIFWNPKYQDDYEKHNSKNIELKMTVKAMASNFDTLKERINYFKYELSHLGSVSKPLTAEQKERILKLFQAKEKPKQKKKPQKLSTTQKRGKTVKAF